MFACAPQDAVVQLDNLVASAQLSARDANQCSRLADVLRRPARICLLGPESGESARVAKGLIGAEALFGKKLPPAVELHYSPDLRTRATLADGTTLEHRGWPPEDILERDPVFLQVFLPDDWLKSISLLVLVLENDPEMQRPALSWAARRSEITVWCTQSFGDADARMLDLAPERLTQHAYLLETRPLTATPRHAAVASFTGSYALGEPDDACLAQLYDRLMADIEDARVADLAMAHLFLHRHGHFVQRAPTSTGTDQSNAAEPSTAGLLALLSEPLLFLMAQAAELADQLSPDTLSDDWVTVALSHCAGTMEDLRDRAENWPDDALAARSLGAMIEEVCDMITLLEIEGKAEQALDAAALLFQLRVAFEQALGWEAT